MLAESAAFPRGPVPRGRGASERPRRDRGPANRAAPLAAVRATRSLGGAAVQRAIAKPLSAQCRSKMNFAITVSAASA